MGLQEPGIEFEPLFEEEYVVVFPKGDELEKSEKLKSQILKEGIL